MYNIAHFNQDPWRFVVELRQQVHNEHVVTA